MPAHDAPTTWSADRLEVQFRRNSKPKIVPDGWAAIRRSIRINFVAMGIKIDPNAVSLMSRIVVATSARGRLQ
jgi:hypothetical protein